jgi:hypothetical protein
MAKDDQDRAREKAAEREAEIESEMRRVGQNPEQLSDGRDTLGSQSAESGRHDEADEEEEPDDDVTTQEESQELPDEHQQEQWADTGGDEELAEQAQRGDE